MLEEALPIAVGVGAALLPAMAFGGLAAARAFIFLAAGERAQVLAAAAVLFSSSSGGWQQQQL